MKKKLLCALLVALISCFLFLTLYILIILNDAKLDISINKNLNKKSKNAQSLEKVCLEKDSLVYRDDIFEYFLFTNETLSFEKWLAKKLEKKEIIFKNPEELIILKELCFSSLKVNDCDQIYCFQHKIPFDDIPGKLWKGLIGVEDYRFLDHAGIDYKSIIRALVADIKAWRLVQGGSTITQQLVKNLFLSNEKSFKRKIKEVIYSIYLESKFSKEEIIAAYINEVFWGVVQNIKIKGVYAASLFYFDKRPVELETYQVAILISMLKGPSFYSPINNLPKLRFRTNYIMRKLKELGLITNNDRRKIWRNDRWDAWHKELLLKQNKASKLAFWKTYKGGGGLLDSYKKFVFHRSVQRITLKLKDRIKDEDVVVKALIGEPLNLEGIQDSFHYYSKIERNSDLAILIEEHQVGSILKPIFYSIFLKYGKKMSDMVSTKKIVLNLKSGSWSPKDAVYIKKSQVTLKEALQRSLNRPTIRVALEVGLDNIQKELDYFTDKFKKPLDEYPSQLIGAVELSLQEIFKIFSKFIIRERMLFDGEVLKVLTDPNCTTVSKMVQNPLNKFKFFGKTGTSNNGLDNWYVAFDGKYFFIIWTGLEGKRENKKLRISGASSSFRIFQDYVLHNGSRFNEFEDDFFYFE